jgi:hypothetical protein
MNKLILIFTILFVGALAQSADAQGSNGLVLSDENNSLHDYTSDGCSWSPDGPVILVNTEFVTCCAQHDVAYWQGGTREQKLEADSTLRSCIAKKSNKVIAEIYYRGVRFGGGPGLPTPFHWGYGWEKRRGYAPLTEDQKQMVQEKLLRINWFVVFTSLGFDPYK